MGTSQTSDLGFKRLGETNWNSWSADMKAKLMEKKVYGVVSGKVTAATPGVDAFQFYIMQEQAAGIIWSGLEESTRGEQQVDCEGADGEPQTHVGSPQAASSAAAPYHTLPSL